MNHATGTSNRRGIGAAVALLTALSTPLATGRPIAARILLDLAGGNEDARNTMGALAMFALRFADEVASVDGVPVEKVLARLGVCTAIALDGGVASL